MRRTTKSLPATLLWLLIFLPAIGQQAKIDSLLWELSVSARDTNRVNILCNLAYEYWLKDPDTGLVYGFKAVELAQRLNWPRGLAKAYNNCGTDYLGKTDWDQSLAYYSRALKLYQNLDDKGHIAATLGNIGNSYFYKSEYDRALKYFSEGMQMDSVLGNERGVAKHYGNIGNVYMGLSNYPKALEHYTHALGIQRKIGNKPAEAIMLSNIATAYAQSSNYPAALEYTLKALEIDEVLDNRVSQARHLGSIGTIYYDTKNYDKALEYLFRALKMNREITSEYAIGINLANIGGVYHEKQNYEEALKFYVEAKALLEKAGSQSETALVLASIGKNYAEQNNFTEALQYYDSSLQLYQALKQPSGIASTSGKIGELYYKMATSPEDAGEAKKNINAKRSLYLDNAQAFLEKAVVAKKELGEKSKAADLLRVLSQVYEAQGNFVQALAYYKEYKEIQDSVFSIENQNKIASLESKKQLEVKDKQIKIQNLQLENNQIAEMSLIGGLGVLILLAGGLAYFLRRIKKQKSVSEHLLLNILPAAVASRLKKKEVYIVDRIEEASILFIDIVDFTGLSKQVGARQIVESLNEIFTAFDHAAGKFGLEKIKTIGDCYMAAAGVPLPQPDHALRATKMALYVIERAGQFEVGDTPVQFRIGMNCGEVTAGVIGEKKFIYDLWGDTVNIAARMESYSKPGEIHITDNFRTTLQDQLEKFANKPANEFNEFSRLSESITLVDQGPQNIKGKGIMQTWFLRKAAPVVEPVS